MESATPAEPSGLAGASAPPQPQGIPFHSSLSAATGEQCSSCGARMAADQRYCVECGERRGEPRFSVADAIGRPASAPAPPPTRRRPRLSPNSTLIAGVGTLLLAMGIGVLIGRTGGDSSSSNAGNQPVKVLNVPSSGSTATTTPANLNAKAPGKAAKAKNSAKGKGGVVGAQTSSVEGKPKQKLPPATVGLGDKGQGAGYKHGKFTGQFFGQ